MHVLRVFLRPGWIALGVVVIAFAALCFSILAPWQLGKNSSTEHRNDLIRSAVEKSAVPIADVAPPGVPFDPETEWREVSLTGRFLTENEVPVRLRSVEERPAVEILTPFAIAGSDRVVLIDRGYIRPEQGAVTPEIPAAPSGEVTINGRIRAGEGTSPGRGAHTDAGRTAVYTIDPAEVGRAEGLTLDPFYLQISKDQPGALGVVPLPQLDSGPYLSYGLQWLAFGIMAPLGAAYFIYSEVKHRRRQREAAATDQADTGEPTVESVTVPDVPNRRQQVRADLHRAGTSSSEASRSTIGHGPDMSSSSSEVREKLSRRYGG